MNAQSVWRRRLPVSIAAASAAMLAVQLAALPAALAQSGGRNKVQVGRELFEHKWMPNDPLSPDGDGLGPMHNAESCVACHRLGGIGGAGGRDVNVELLSALPSSGNAGAASNVSSKAKEVHPGFSAGGAGASSVLLHRFSTDDGYDRWRMAALGTKLPTGMQPAKAQISKRAIERKMARQPPVAELPRQHGVAFRLSRRNTTSLFGAGLIDTIPEKALFDLEEEQPKKHPGINGRVGRTASGHVGHFGWRGQVATLRDFVLTACAMELGLQNQGHPQALDPMDPDRKPVGDDLTAEQCDALVAFVASLPAPRQIRPTNREQANELDRGERFFETLGCAACHVRDVWIVQGLYSDLLLHDMGSGLEDPVPAFPERIRVGTASSASAYGGGPVDVMADRPSPLRREWKTPPLWGVRDSAPYLHDGRALTIHDAILAHGGEGSASATRYRDLDTAARSALLAFLNSLAAPDRR